ncbi:hypothetical protein ScalyP_jg2996 [Parmales sp. scaly parma]|nr:hypothetical protein ScalyP_jg2996 [Parmales sp. scaly parma]
MFKVVGKTLILILFVFRLVDSDPKTLPLPSLFACIDRVRALFSLHTDVDDPRFSNHKIQTFALKARIWLTIRTLYYLCISPVWLLLWAIDDFFFPYYRKESLENSVFIVGGFRTGSTSLHRAISLDEERFVSPRFLEIFVPFVSFHKFLDLIEFLDAKLHTKLVASLEARLQAVVGTECMARHPMTYWEAEEDDCLPAGWHFAGWYSSVIFPDARCWMKSGEISKFPPEAQLKLFKFYERALQKVLYRRGNGRLLLSKSHLIEFMPILAANLKKVHFVGTVRHPKDTFVSWYALNQCTALSLARWKMPTETAAVAHIKFWESFTNAEIRFFGRKHDRNNKEKDKDKDKDEDEGNNMSKSIVTFKQYIADQEGTVKRLFKEMGFCMSEKFTKALREDTQAHVNYKGNRSYENPSLEDLGVDVNELEEILKPYITEFTL